MATDKELFDLSASVGRKLRAAGKRLATAESCTAGWVAKALTDLPGSSQWFDSGFVTYSNAAKVRDVGVLASTLEKHGAVSEATVREMAAGALRVSGADIAVAISGIAGPDGGTAEKPVGTVWFGVASRRGGGGTEGRGTEGRCAREGDARMGDGPGARGGGKAEGALASERQLFPGDREEVRRRSVERALQLVLGLDLGEGRG